MNNKIPAVEKTIALLELLAKLPEGATQAELKKELGISMSTAYRILQTLQKLLVLYNFLKVSYTEFKSGSTNSFKTGVVLKKSHSHCVDNWPNSKNQKKNNGWREIYPRFPFMFTFNHLHNYFSK